VSERQNYSLSKKGTVPLDLITPYPKTKSLTLSITFHSHPPTPRRPQGYPAIGD
jgi:hypothetical protein